MKNRSIVIFLITLLFFGPKTEASSYILITKDLIERPAVPDENGVDFVFICNSLEKAQDFILENLCIPNTDIPKEDIIIYIKQGTYFQGPIFWTATSPEKTVTIKPYPNEEVIFDGRKGDGTLAQLFFELSNRHGRSNLRIEGLIIQNFANGIWLGNTIRDENGDYFKGIQNSHNIIKDNVFRNIGNKYSKHFQAGYSALGINNSMENIIVGNTFCYNENNKLNEKNYKTNSLMHSIYIAHYSSKNSIKGNYISHCSGDAIRIRNGSNENYIVENHILLSGTLGFITEWYRLPEVYPNSPEESSNGTKILNNICFFSYPDGDKKEIFLFRSNVNNGFLNKNYIDGGTNLVNGLYFDY